jgi:cardiolipin synthase
MIEFISYKSHIIIETLLIATDVLATAHVVLQKRDNRAAISWVGLIWFFPVGGLILYFLFGINRIQRRAKRLRKKAGIRPAAATALQNASRGRRELARVLDHVCRRPLTDDNQVETYDTGEAAYISMLAAIDAATRSVALSTYIFDNDSTGKSFVTALANAAKRGVLVRVLVDDVGSRYSFPTIIHRLRANGVPTARFMRTLLPWSLAYAQLRNHRKLLVLDGRVGFTGGMNIRDGHDARTHPRDLIVDLQARFDGPVVADLMTTFAEDWQFAAGESLTDGCWFPILEGHGDIPARGIASGPDDNFEKLRLAYLGALGCARRSITIVTPYFLPDYGLISSLNVAALRGVHIEIIVPERSNLRLVQWAMMAQLSQVLDHGCRVWLCPPPFDHTKLLVVDDYWCLIGSANWDPRSLRLNFEFNVECYSESLVARFQSLIAEKLSRSRRLTEHELNQRSLPVKLRDGVARLASPYL